MKLHRKIYLKNKANLLREGFEESCYVNPNFTMIWFASDGKNSVGRRLYYFGFYK